MRPLSKLAVVSAAAIGVLGAAGLAAAEIKNDHVLTLRLPDGSQEQIRYAGDVPPQVSVEPGWASLTSLPSFDAAFGQTSTFAALDRISAEMDREAANLWRQEFQLNHAAFGPAGGLTQATLAQLPPGVQAYSVVSTMTNHGLCTRTVQYESSGEGAKPKVLTRASGNCGELAGAPASSSGATQAALPQSAPPNAYGMLTHKISLND